MVVFYTSGTVLNKYVTVMCEVDDTQIKILFDGAKYPPLEEHFYKKLHQVKSMGGTFYPAEKSPLNVLNTLQHNFFDDTRTPVGVDGELETIPFMQGVIF